MTVKIYLRSIVHNKQNHLAMFDTNRGGDINNLTTVVPHGGAKVIWKLDCFSGIKSITKIHFKKGEFNVFKSNPKKLLLCKGFKLLLSEEAEGEEAYTIECILSDGTELIIDPFIRVPPPPTGG
jgi:hypothetical protein